MYVCLCKGITDSQIRAAVQAGAASLREVRDALGVASQCGKCGLLARDIVRQSLGGQEDDNGQFFYAVG
jgi:bacterioferritin-associated ferredoxin